jgi:hypothetical protein
MRPDAPVLPPKEVIRAHTLTALSRYWPNDPKPIESLPVAQRSVADPIAGPLCLVEIKLPEWAANCGVDGMLLVPQEAVDQNQPSAELWQQTDWWLAAFLLLEGWHERVWEHEHGPIHSYSFRLTGWDERAWQHAWVNRIALFLRRWSEQVSGSEVTERMGPLPKPVIQMTHDVDAVAKTLPIRLKQGAFNLFNAVRSLSRGQFRQTGARLSQATRFLLGQENWWTFDQLQQWEADAGIQATYHFHADRQPKTLKRWLFDPGYDIVAPKQRALLSELIEQGHKVGLHPGFETWQDPKQIESQRSWVEAAAGTSVNQCRQHWLRFSWRDTWSAQQNAGLTQDSTLMFNDGPGFRNSSALSWQPYNPNQAATHELRALPTLFMDSHFYDYKPMSATARQSAMRHWIRECQSVNGEAAVLWHPHTLTQDYGWSDGFHDVINLIREPVTCQSEAYYQKV